MAQHSTSTSQQSIDRIAELMAPLGVASETASSLTAVAQAIAAKQQAFDASEVLISTLALSYWPGLAAALDAAGVRYRIPGDLSTTRDALLGVSLADGAIVETGSIILAEPSLHDRGVGLLSLNQIMLIPVERIVPSLTEAAQIVREVAMRGGYATFVTGPSRTADIEMSLTVGVQGPGTVSYLFVEDVR